MKEIGSEFSIEPINEGSIVQIPGITEGTLVFSGRTAIETVLKNELKIHKALLPSYCCDSMIEPFRKAGIDIGFYNVNYDNGMEVSLDISKDTDCILWCNYFGFSNNMPDLSDFINRNGVIIEDITHSFYSTNMYHEQSEYLVASLRKWEPVLCGGYCLSRKKTLSFKPTKKPAESFIIQKEKAMILKKQYLEGKIDINKDAFLDLFSKANKWIEDNYSELTIDEYSKTYLLKTDYSIHRKKRIQNAGVLYSELYNHPYIDFLFPIENMDCPLFVPIVIKDSKRDIIRKKLIKNRIYCPVHWPHPNDICCSNLYDIELSLVCDHRYSETDMKTVTDILKNI